MCVVKITCARKGCCNPIQVHAYNIADRLNEPNLVFFCTKCATNFYEYVDATIEFNKREGNDIPRSEVIKNLLDKLFIIRDIDLGALCPDYLIKTAKHI